MAESRTGAAFRVTDDLTEEEKLMWAEARTEYTDEVVRLSQCRDNGTLGYTEEDLSQTLEAIDKIRAARTQPQCQRGDLAGSARAVYADGDVDGERRDPEEYRNLLESARPLIDEAKPVTVDYAADPFARLCVTAIPAAVATILRRVNDRLKSVQRSQTEFQSVDAFAAFVNLETFSPTQQADIYVFGVYGPYSVTCQLSDRLIWYGFTRAPHLASCHPISGGIVRHDSQTPQQNQPTGGRSTV